MLLRRIFCVLLMVLMLLTSIAACTGNNEPSGDKVQGSTQSSTTAGTEGKDTGLPIVKEPLTITYFAGLNANAAVVVQDYSAIEAMKVIKEKTGIDIKWMHPPVGQEKEQFNLLISSNDLPDIIEYTWTTLYEGGPEKALNDGVFIKLNDLIGQHAPNLSKVYKENPEIKKQVTTDNGTMYCFPYLYLDPELEGPFKGYQIRKDWLEKLNLKIPETLDDWHQVLTAFRNNDPNGNKEKDELPFSAVGGTPSSGMSTDIRFFMTPWGMTAEYSGWYRVNNKIQFAFSQPEYLEFLKTMAQWYKEGLIDPDYAITDAKGFDSKVTTNKTGSYFGYPGSRLGRYLTLMEKENPDVKLAGVPYPVLKAGEKPLVGHKNNNFNGLGAVISTKNKHVTESIKWLDYMYGEEGHKLVEYGIEGKSYAIKDGRPAFTEEIRKNPDGLSMTQAIAKYSFGSFASPRVHDYNSEKQQQARPEQVDALSAWFLEAKDRNLPPITQSPDEGQKYANIMNEINTFVNETENKVIMGATPIESFNFDEYLKTLKDMGIDEAMKIQQAALDRFNSR